MKSLKTLLRIAKGDLETLRRALGDQIAIQLSLEERMRTHEQSIVDEQKAALRDYEGARAYGGFAAHATAGRRALAAQAHVIDEECDRLRALISEAHVELSKFERLVELQEARERAALAKREAAELDEIATLRAGRAQRP